MKCSFKGDPRGLQASDLHTGNEITHGSRSTCIPLPVCSVPLTPLAVPWIYHSSVHLHQASLICLFVSLTHFLCCIGFQVFIHLPAGPLCLSVIWLLGLSGPSLSSCPLPNTSYSARPLQAIRQCWGGHYQAIHPQSPFEIPLASCMTFVGKLL